MRLKKNEKGISPIFATILMLLVVVIGASIIFNYFIFSTADFQKGQGSAVMEFLVIEDVWFKIITESPPHHLINISFYNYGEIKIKLTSLYINGLAVTFEGDETNCLTIPPGEHELMIAYPSEWIPNTNYSFKMISERGTIFEGEYKSPKS